PLIVDGTRPQVSGLTIGGDGSLYGATWQGGDMGFGTVFRLFSSAPVVVITDVAFSPNALRLSITGGAAGQLFEIQAADSFPGWLPIRTGEFGIAGRYEFFDPDTSSHRIRLYRTLIK